MPVDVVKGPYTGKVLEVPLTGSTLGGSAGIGWVRLSGSSAPFPADTTDGLAVRPIETKNDYQNQSIGSFQHMSLLLALSESTI